MDESTNQTPSGSSMNKMLIPAVVVGILVIALIAFFALGMNRSTSTGVTQPTQQETAQVTAAPSSTNTPITGTEGAMTTSDYKDGSYSATGHYVSPGGPRDVDVTVTLKDGVITTATFEGHATDPNSKHFQGEFKENFQSQVVGKNINDVELTKVAGSSLSPKGFMDALTQIKDEAKA